MNLRYIKGLCEVAGLGNVYLANILKSKLQMALLLGQKELPKDSTGLMNLALIRVSNPSTLDNLSKELKRSL